MPARDPLHRVAVSSPCSQDWDSMIGNDRVRFCEHCSLDVHNISEMTRAEALRLANRSNGRLCVRYHSTTQNPIVTRTRGARRLHQIGRRVSRLASGAFSATLSVSAVFAEPATVQGDNFVVSQVMDAKAVIANGGSLAGTVVDLNEARIAGASLVLTNAQTQFEIQGTSNDAGEFRFDGLSEGSYTLRVTAPGFAPLIMTNINVNGTQGAEIKMTMQVSETTVTMGVLGVMSPSHPFVKAAHDDDLDALRALIADTDVNLRDPDSGTTALDHAVQNGNQEMVQFLIARGADVNASVEDGGHTALMQLGHDATPDLLWELINAGAKINHKNSYGTTALMSVASQNNSEILEELLAAGADVNVADEDGKTALMIAASEGSVLNVRLLLLAGARIDARDGEGKNALMHAIENEHRAVIRFLRSKGAVEVPLKEDKEEKEEEEN